MNKVIHVTSYVPCLPYSCHVQVYICDTYSESLEYS